MHTRGNSQFAYDNVAAMLLDSEVKAAASESGDRRDLLTNPGLGLGGLLLHPLALLLLVILRLDLLQLDPQSVNLIFVLVNLNTAVTAGKYLGLVHAELGVHGSHLLGLLPQVLLVHFDRVRHLRPRLSCEGEL